MKKSHSKVLAFALILAVALSLFSPNSQVVQAVSPNIVISQVYGGGGNSGATYTHDFIELYNLGPDPVDVTGWSVQYAAASGTSWAVTGISGVLNPGQYYLVQEAQGAGGTTPLPAPDSSGSIAMSANNGKVALVNSTTPLTGTGCPFDASVVDFVGFGSANCFEGSGATPALTNTTAAIRAGGGSVDTDSNSSDFATGAPNPRNSTFGVEDLAPSVTATVPENAAVDVAIDAAVSLTFSEAVNVSGDWFSIACSMSGVHSAAVSGGPDSFTLDPDVDFANAEDCTVTVAAAAVTDQDADDPPDNMEADHLFSFTTIVGAVSPGSPNVVISQVYGGGGNATATLKNDFIELYNRGVDPVDITGWSVQYASAMGSSWLNKTELSGVLQPGQYYLIQGAAGSGGTVDLPTPDVVGSINLSGTNGKVALVNSMTELTSTCPAGGAGVVDFVGYGTANCYEGAAAPVLSNTTAAIRGGAGSVDTDNNAADFTAGAPTPRNSSFGFDQAPTVTSTTPASGGFDVPADANISITFSEAVNVSGDWFSIACDASGAHTAVVSGGPETYTLDPDTDFTGLENCTVTVYAANVTDADPDDPPDNPAADYSFGFTTFGDVCLTTYTPAYEIQGGGSETPIPGTVVTTQGVVVGDYEGPSPTLRGFYIQDVSGDGDAGTSDAVFVFNGNTDSVSLGEVVRVTGRAFEFQDQTQLDTVSSIVSCGTGTVDPVDVTFPVPSLDYLEQFEGMLVRLPQTLYVTEHFQLGRFGQVVLSAGGRLQQPTNVVEPGAPALELQDANNRSRIIIDDSTNDQNPDPILFARGGQPLSAENTLRGGDTATGIVGVMTYTWAGNSASGNAYRVRPVNALGGGIPNFEPVNLRPEAAPNVGGSLRVAGMNLLNYFNTFGATSCTMGVGGEATECRGAEDPAEFERQSAKTVAAIIGTGADVVGIIEIENDGYGPDSALQTLVNQLNAAAGAGTYAFINVDTATGQINALGTDAIKVALVYKPASVTPVGTTAVLNTPEFVTGGDSDERNRPSLAQAFEEVGTGGRFIVDVNHLKSKGSACDNPDAGDGQGNCNDVRTVAANLLAGWLASDPTGTGEPDILILGDLNSYAMEDPIDALQSAGYLNMIMGFLGADAYSYVFDGQWGYLDHALGTASLADQVTGVGDWHINADEPSVLDYNTNFKSPGQVESLYSPDEFRISDHDPVIVGLQLDGEAPTVDVQLSPNILKPANHKYVRVTATVTVSDNLDPDPLVELVSVTSNEPDNGTGDGDTANDIVILDDFTFNLRAERSGSGQGRIYTVTYRVTDAYGNVTLAEATVTVPKGNSKK